MLDLEVLFNRGTGIWFEMQHDIKSVHLYSNFKVVILKNGVVFLQQGPDYQSIYVYDMNGKFGVN